MDLTQALAFCKKSFWSVAVFSGVANLLMLTPAFYMLNVYDKAVAFNSINTLMVLSLLTLGMFVALGAIEAIRSRVLVAVSSRLDRLLGPELYLRTFRNAVNVGALQANTRPLQDLNALRQFLTGNGVFALFDAPWVPIYVLVLFLFHPMLGWMGVIAAALFVGLALLNERLVSPGLTAANALAHTTNGATLRALRNAEAVDAMGMVAELQRQARSSQERLLAEQEQASNIAGSFAAVIKVLRLAIQSAALGAGAYLAMAQEISPGMIIAGSILIGRALQPVELATGAWKGFVEARQQYARLDEIIANIPLDREKMLLPEIMGEVRANNAAIIPPGASQPSVRNASFVLPAGSTTIVIGSSGAGKSSLIRGLLGLWPTAAGEIRLDGAEIRHYDRQQLGPQIGYLPQDIELLEGSIADNIARFSVPDPDCVLAAAQHAGVHDFILSLPQGYDTVIDGPGGMLSPGQRQRVGLARALYKLPKLVVLDEPNSNLDDVGNKALIEAIKTLQAHGSTIIVVSHRNDLMPLADHLVIMSSGTVVDSGPAAEVSARAGAHHANRLTLPGNNPSMAQSDSTVSKPLPKRPQTVTWPAQKD